MKYVGMNINMQPLITTFPQIWQFNFSPFLQRRADMYGMKSSEVSYQKDFKKICTHCIQKFHGICNIQNDGN